MANLKSAIKRIQNKGKKSVDPKKNKMVEAAPVVSTTAKVAGRAVARKLIKRRNVKNPKYRKFEKDDEGNIVKGKEFDKKLYDQDGNKKTQGYMSTMDGPTDKRSTTFDGSMRQRKKEDDAAEKRVQDTASSLKKGVKKTGNIVKGTVKKTGSMAKKTTSAVTGGFGTSSFKKESKITFKDYLNKL